MSSQEKSTYSVAAACRETNLSEKRIYRFIDEGMIHEPLTEEDLTKLKDFQWLEENVLGIDRIQTILNHPAWVPGQPELGYKRVQMEMNRIEQASSRRFTRLFKYLLLLLLVIITFWFSYGLGFVGLFSFAAVILLFLAMVYGFIALTYYQDSTQAMGSLTHAHGQIVSVMEDHGTRATRIKAGSSWLSDGEPASSGAWWHLILMILYEFRTDCWYPVIEFWNEDGMLISGTLHYSGWKDTWKAGQSLEVTWKGTNTDDLYPTDNSYVTQKMKIFIAKAGICLGLGLILVITVNILNML